MGPSSRASCSNSRPRDRLVFADAQGRLISVKAGDIAERKPQTTSIMPENLARAMTLQEISRSCGFLVAAIEQDLSPRCP